MSTYSACKRVSCLLSRLVMAVCFSRVIRCSQEDIRHVRLSYDKSALEMGSLTSKIEELELHIDNAQRAHKKAISTKEVRMDSVVITFYWHCGVAD